jgi:lysophospholipase L1-like esterase
VLAVAAAALIGCGGEPEPAATDRATAIPSGTGAGGEPLLQGGERLLFIGDSLAVEAPPNYPELLPDALRNRAARVETVNLAEPGTTARDWLPGGELFERRLEGELGSADVVVVTLGGNDLQEALGGIDGVEALSDAGADSAGDALAAIETLERRLRRLNAAIRRRVPDARIVYLGYPDYSEATVWRQAGGAAGTLALELGLGALLGAAEAAGPDLVVDMRPASRRAGVDGLLADSEHLGPAGHALYAQRLARELTRDQAPEAAGSASSP